MKNKKKEEKKGKSDIRTEFLKKRSELSKEQCKTNSIEIAKKVLSLKRLQKAETIFLYASYKNEVETKKLIKKLLSIKKRVALPKVRGKEMDFFLIHSLDELVFGYQGILEPDGLGQIVVPTKKDVILLPGVVFDKIGNRIGYGGGYYDRYLANLKEELPYLVGLGYEVQLYKGMLPVETQDKKVDTVVTEKKIYKRKKQYPWVVEVILEIVDFILTAVDFTELID